MQYAFVSTRSVASKAFSSEVPRTNKPCLGAITGAALFLIQFSCSRTLLAMLMARSSVPDAASTEPAIELLGYAIEPAAQCALAEGEDLRITQPASCPLRLILYWKALSSLETDFSVFVHLVGEDEQLRAQHDGPPQGGAFPTLEWLPGDVIADAHELVLPPEAEPGRYAIRAGLYSLGSGERLPAYDERDLRWADDAIELNTTIEVSP